MNNNIKLTQRESDLIKLLPINNNGENRLTTTQLVTLYFGKDAPLNARNIIIGRLRIIDAKAARMGYPWHIVSTYRSGPNPQAHWVSYAPRETQHTEAQPTEFGDVEVWDGLMYEAGVGLVAP